MNGDWRCPRFAELDALIRDHPDDKEPRAQYARLGRPPGLSNRDARRHRLEAIAAQMRARYQPENQGVTSWRSRRRNRAKKEKA